MQVGAQLRIAPQLLADESKAARMGARYLHINPEVWDKFVEEVPFATYYNRSRMTYYACKVLLDPSVKTWEFNNEDACGA